MLAHVETTASPDAGALAQVVRLADTVRDWLQRLTPIGDLVLRCWLAKIFWVSGLVKYQSWETTLLLFEYEYQVPLLPPGVAALAATASELLFSVLLAFGLAGRVGALGLFAVNAMAVISYPALNEVAREHHFMWGLMLLVPLLHGPGKLSIDHWLVIRRGR
jgi:putative oxidoreductase